MTTWNASFNRWDGDPEYDPPDEMWDHCNDCGSDFYAPLPHQCPCPACGSANVEPVKVEDEEDPA